MAEVVSWVRKCYATAFSVPTRPRAVKKLQDHLPTLKDCDARLIGLELLLALGMPIILSTCETPHFAAQTNKSNLGYKKHAIF